MLNKFNQIVSYSVKSVWDKVKIILKKKFFFLNFLVDCKPLKKEKRKKKERFDCSIVKALKRNKKKKKGEKFQKV